MNLQIKAAKHITFLFIGMLLFTNCSSTKTSPYPDTWPELDKSFNISGKYKNIPIACTNTDYEQSLFSFFLRIHRLGSYRSVGQNEKTAKIDYKELHKKNALVEVAQNEKTITVTLLNKGKLIKKIVFPFYKKENNKVLLFFRNNQHGELLYNYSIELMNSIDGSLIANIKIKQNYGHFIESSKKFNLWSRWEKQ